MAQKAGTYDSTELTGDNRGNRVAPCHNLRLNTDYTDKKRITRIRARPAQKTEKCKTEKWESFNRQDTRAPGSHQGSILFQFVGHRNKLEQNGTLKPLAALLVCGVHSQSDGFKSALASFIARSSTRTSPRFELRSGVKVG